MILFGRGRLNIHKWIYKHGKLSQVYAPKRYWLLFLDNRILDTFSLLPVTLIRLWYIHTMK